MDGGTDGLKQTRNSVIEVAFSKNFILKLLKYRPERLLLEAAGSVIPAVPGSLRTF